MAHRLSGLEGEHLRDSCLDERLPNASLVTEANICAALVSISGLAIAYQVFESERLCDLPLYSDCLTAYQIAECEQACGSRRLPNRLSGRRLAFPVFQSQPQLQRLVHREDLFCQLHPYVKAVGHHFQAVRPPVLMALQGVGQLQFYKFTVAAA